MIAVSLCLCVASPPPGLSTTTRERFAPGDALPAGPTIDQVRDGFATLMALHVLAKQELAARPVPTDLAT